MLNSSLLSRLLSSPLWPLAGAQEGPSLFSAMITTVNTSTAGLPFPLPRWAAGPRSPLVPLLANRGTLPLPPPTPLALLALLLAALTTVMAVDYGRMLWLRRQMPPGPWPWPIVGNTFSLPDEKPWIYFEELGKRYGNADLITFWIGR